MSIRVVLYCIVSYRILFVGKQHSIIPLNHPAIQYRMYSMTVLTVGRATSLGEKKHHHDHSQALSFVKVPTVHTVFPSKKSLFLPGTFVS
mmetsp:Transcript_20143/g.22675  ORF Transcript_20143/g.22675 Transcript_20143/m.22675 type:complete len:90 (+) Transcript_20143:202-471(+)